MAKLTGKVALVTGASKGIGAEIAKSLAAEGASVVVNYSSSKDGAEKVVADIKAKGGKAVAVQGDFSKKEDIGKVFAEVKKTFGRLDTLVNNAGVYAFSPLEDVTEEHFHKLFNLNVLGLILASKEAAKHFGWFAAFASLDCPASSKLTQERLGWRAVQRSLLDDLERGSYFNA